MMSVPSKPPRRRCHPRRAARSLDALFFLVASGMAICGLMASVIVTMDDRQLQTIVDQLFTTASNPFAPLQKDRVRPQQLRYHAGSVQRVHALPRLHNRARDATTRIPNDWDSYDPNEKYEDGCHFRNPNYHQLYPSGPIVHAMDLTTMSFINCGGTRCAFDLPDTDPSSSDKRVVLKMLKVTKDYKLSRWDRARMDGLVMEQATSSPFIASVYGTCGLSQVLEYSAKGTLHDMIKVSRKAARDAMSPVDKLKLLVHIASAITDLHQVGAVHGDLSSNQFLHVDGVYKLNDFHISMFTREDDNQHVCFDTMGFSSDNYIIHAPEEKDRNAVDLAKADVYVMGHVMFNTYAKTWLYEGIPEPQALDMLYAGTHTPFPPALDATISANAAMQTAILQCWTQDPKERPSARSVRDFLLRELSRILGKTIHPGDSILKVQIDPLPKDHRYTISSMDGANEGTPRQPRQIEFNNQR